MANRKLAEKMIFDFLKRLDPSGHNVEMYKKILPEMTDKAFDEYMRDILADKKSLVIFTPILKTKGLNVENNLKLAEELGIPLFERLVYKDTARGTFTTPHKVLLLDLPINRKAQSLDKKKSIPGHNKIIDQMTYTPTGESKGSTLSNPELGIYNSMGLHNIIEELFRVRGGDKGGFRAFNAAIDRYGSVSLKSISPYLTGVESTKRVKSYFAAAHLKFEV